MALNERQQARLNYLQKYRPDDPQVQKLQAMAGGEQASTSAQKGLAGKSLGVSRKTGAINPNKAVPTVTSAVNQDIASTFNMNNPGSQTDAAGNSQQITRDPVTGEVKIVQTGGQNYQGASNAFLSALNDFSGNGQNARMSAQDAAYGYITKDYGEQKNREIAAERQRLAEQGIPDDPGDLNNPYQKLIGRIDNKYQGLYDQAKNQAILSGNSIYSTNAGVVNTLGGTVQGQTPNFTPYAGGQSNSADYIINLIKTMSDADLAKYGIDKDTATKLKTAKIAAGASGGGSSDSGFLIGGTAP